MFVVSGYALLTVMLVVAMLVNNARPCLVCR